MNQLTKARVLIVAGLTCITVGALTSMPVVADNAMQTVEMVRVDVQKLSTGYRTSKIIGSNVTNDSNETIGKVDDLIVSPDDNKSAYVILSVGGWLGMGSHMIALPYDNLHITNTKITLPGATKDDLKNLPEFKYSTT
jgi:sporulation protein YlmC with PRC-barrel domain